MVNNPKCHHRGIPILAQCNRHKIYSPNVVAVGVLSALPAKGWVFNADKHYDISKIIKLNRHNYSNCPICCAYQSSWRLKRFISRIRMNKARKRVASCLLFIHSCGNVLVKRRVMIISPGNDAQRNENAWSIGVIAADTAAKC